MRLLAPLIVTLPVLAAASAPVQRLVAPFNAELAQARAEQAAAEAETAKLQKLATDATDDASRLRAEQEAAAQGIDAAEARITASDMQLRLAATYVAAHRQRLAMEQRPIASLLAGLATMAERPPLLALADKSGTDELVKVRILLDSTLPVIRARTGRLSSQLASGERLQRQAFEARDALVRSRRELSSRREQFAALEQRALDRAQASGSQALGAGDAAIAAGEDVERLRGSEQGSRDALRLAADLASEQPAPARPLRAEGTPPPTFPFAYRLPIASRVVEGLGAVNASGVQSRGLTLAASRGEALSAPADGLVRYSGPYRDYDGILIIDHGGGWLSLIVNVATPLQAGAKLRLGDPIGRTLGPIQVELSQNGRRVSPALIAGSSATLSKAGKGG
jgi:septal ring factor EnvC (AmiA/AmiB activator)